MSWFKRKRPKRVPKNFGHSSHDWQQSMFSSIGPTIGYYCANCGASYTRMGDVFDSDYEPSEGCDQQCPYPGRADRYLQVGRAAAHRRALAAAKQVVACLEGGVL